jgi:hypothetical protein
MPGDRLRAPGGAAGEQPGDPHDKTGLQFQILGSPALGVPFPPPHSGVLVGEALLLCLFERCFFDQEALPLVPLARPAPPDHHGRKGAGFLRPTGERGVAGRQEYQVIQVGASEAERPPIVHDQTGTSAEIHCDRQAASSNGSALVKKRSGRHQAVAACHVPWSRRPVRRGHVADAGGSVSEAMHAVSRRRI